MIIQAKRYHDISCGHRVYGHEGACAHLHGHNYRVHFTCEADALDSVGRVIDFSDMKSRLCMWLEAHWDHKFLIWGEDPAAQALWSLDPTGIVVVGFNPTAERLAEHLVEVVGPGMLAGTGIVLTSVEIEETRKCSAQYTRSTAPAPEVAVRGPAHLPHYTVPYEYNVGIDARLPPGVRGEISVLLQFTDAPFHISMITDGPVVETALESAIISSIILGAVKFTGVSVRYTASPDSLSNENITDMTAAILRDAGLHIRYSLYSPTNGSISLPITDAVVSYREVQLFDLPINY